MKTGFENNLAVPWDASLPQARLYRQILEPVLEHWKLPFRFIPLSSLKKTGAAVFFLFQPGLGSRLKREHFRPLEKAFREGAGIFFAEPSVLKNRHFKESAFSSYAPQISGAEKSNELTVSDRPHFVLETKKPGERIAGIPGLNYVRTAKVPEGWNPLVRSGNAPWLLLHAERRLGLLLLEPRSLLNGAGFGTEIDVLIWRSLVWLARKPFAQLLPPRFLTYRIEDCVGEGGFKYADEILRSGFRLHMGLDLNDFDFSKGRRLRKYFRQQKLEFSPHAFTHYKRTPAEQTDLIYARFDGGELPEKKLNENFARLTAFERRAGLKFSPVLTFHYCQLGRNSLKFLKKRGVRSLVFPFRTNVSLDRSLEKKWRCFPFGKFGMVCDRFPDDRDLWVISASDFPDVPVRHLKKMDVGMTSRLDYLFGFRLKSPGKNFEQYEEVRERVRRYARKAYENLFFACLFTHETLINYLKLSEFKKLTAVLRKDLKVFKPKDARYQDIAAYFMARAQSRIENSRVANGCGSCTIVGPRGAALDLCVYTEKGGKVRTNLRQIKLSGKKQKAAF